MSVEVGAVGGPPGGEGGVVGEWGGKIGGVDGPTEVAGGGGVQGDGAIMINGGGVGAVDETLEEAGDVWLAGGAPEIATLANFAEGAEWADVAAGGVEPMMGVADKRWVVCENIA